MTDNKTLEGIFKKYPMKHRPIDSKHGWDEDYLYENLDRMQDIKNYSKALREQPLDIGAGEDICEAAFGREAGQHVYYNVLTPQLTGRLAKNVNEDNVDKMVGYTMNHLDKILDIFNDKELYNLVFDVPIYKIDEEEHDRTVDAINNLKGKSEIGQKKDLGKMREIVANGLKNPSLPEWALKFASVAIGNDRFVQFMFDEEVKRAGEFVQAELIKNEKVDEDKIKKMIKDSIAEVEWEWKEEKDSKDQRDAWKKDIRPLATIAQHTYGALRRKYYEDNDDEQDKNERAERRHRKGMRL